MVWKLIKVISYRHYQILSLAKLYHLQRVFLFVWFLGFFGLVRATPATYGSSQARGRIGAVPASLHHSHSNTGSKRHVQLHHSSQQYQILNPLSEARDGTCILMDASQIRFCCATMGTPRNYFFNFTFGMFIVSDFCIIY